MRFFAFALRVSVCEFSSDAFSLFSFKIWYTAFLEPLFSLRTVSKVLREDAAEFPSVHRVFQFQWVSGASRKIASYSLANGQLGLRLPCLVMSPYTWAEKFESFERINSIRETNGNSDSCNSCKRLVPSRLHELHESKFPFVSRIEFIRSKLSNFSAHVYGVYVRCWSPVMSAWCHNWFTGLVVTLSAVLSKGSGSGQLITVSLISTTGVTQIWWQYISYILYTSDKAAHFL